MRCSHCDADNDDASAFCHQCSNKLTAYAEVVIDQDKAAKLAKLNKVNIRPAGVMAMAGATVALAVFGPFGKFASMFFARPAVREDGMNYAASAFSAVNVTLAGIFFIPVGIFLLILAFSTWTQRSWAYHANTVLLGLVGLSCITGFWPGGIWRWILLVATAAFAFLWFRTENREWFGFS